MNDIYETLTKELLDKNDKLTHKLVRGLSYYGKIFKQLMQNQVVIKAMK